jgi:periplasmic divalent cation tolerance protein
MLSMKNDYCQLWLTCADKKEAKKIANTLLVKHLITCAKMWSVDSSFRWQGKIEPNDEVLLMMDSRSDLFEIIEVEIAKIHSYDTFVMQATPVTGVSKDAKKWLKEELKA